MDDRQREIRGERARQMLEDELFQEAWRVPRERIHKMLEREDLSGKERKRLNFLLQALRQVELHVQQVMVTGTLAGREIERKRSIADRVLRRA